MASIEKRESKSGKVTYRVKIRLKGHRPESGSFERITDAKKWAKLTESAILEGRHFKTSQSRRHTLAELLDKYKLQIIPQKRSQRTQLGMLEWWRKEAGHLTIADATPSVIANYRDQLLHQIGRAHV